MTELKCKDLVKSRFDSRIEDIKKLYQAESWQGLKEYALSTDFVPAHTFQGQNCGYWRYQISWGGPQDEFRVYSVINKVEYWYSDWFDGASVPVKGRNATMIKNIIKNTK